MAQEKQPVESTSADKVNQRDCLVFSTNLYHYVTFHPAVQKFLPPPMAEEEPPLFIEDIGKAVLIVWYVQQQEFQRYDQFNLRWLAGRNMKSHLHHLCKRMFKANKNVFRAVLYMTAFLMETHLFLYQRSYEGALKHLPALWTDIFQTHFARNFFSKGGWLEFKCYCLDGSRKYDVRLKGRALQPKFNSYVISNLKYKKVDRTKEFRLFIVQKTLEFLKTIHEKILTKESSFIEALSEVKDLSKVVNKISKVCYDLDFGNGELEVLNEKLSKRIYVFCVRFYSDEEFTRFINKMRYDPRDCQDDHDQNAPYELFEDFTEPPSLFTEGELENINLQWVDEIAQVRHYLRLVMPPGTDDSFDCNIDCVLYDSHARDLLKKIGGLRVGGNSLSNIDMNEVKDELKRYGLIAKVAGQMGEQEMLEEQIIYPEVRERLPGQASPDSKLKARLPGQTPPRPKGKARFPGQTPPDPKGKARLPGQTPAGPKGKARLPGQTPPDPKGKARFPGQTPPDPKGKARFPGQTPPDPKGKARFPGQTPPDPKGKVRFPGQTPPDPKGKARLPGQTPPDPKGKARFPGQTPPEPKGKPRLPGQTPSDPKVKARLPGQSTPERKTKLPGQTTLSAKKRLSGQIPKAGSSSGQPITPPCIATEGARPKFTLSSSSESTPGGESSISNLESSAEDPSVEERMKDLGISGKKMEYPKMKSPKSTSRKSTGSLR